MKAFLKAHWQLLIWCLYLEITQFLPVSDLNKVLLIIIPGLIWLGIKIRLEIKEIDKRIKDKCKIY